MPNTISTLATVLVASAVLWGGASGLEGQTAFLGGVVVEEGSGRLLGGVTLTAQEADLVAVSDESGQFTFSGLRAGEITLRASLDGYASVVEPLEIVGGEAGFVQLRLPAFAAALEELLVIGDRSSLGSEAPALDEGGQGTAADLLESRFPGLNLRRNAGSAGGGANVRLRGTNSLYLSNEAVIYVDGVRVSPRMGSLGLRSSDELHLLETIPAASVDRIRILKGPSATARYPDTSNGVILVETVHGAPTGATNDADGGR